MGISFELDSFLGRLRPARVCLEHESVTVVLPIVSDQLL